MIEAGLCSPFSPLRHVVPRWPFSRRLVRIDFPQPTHSDPGLAAVRLIHSFVHLRNDPDLKAGSAHTQGAGSRIPVTGQPPPGR
jgi:hypothetical protein